MGLARLCTTVQALQREGGQSESASMRAAAEKWGAGQRAFTGKVATDMQLRVLGMDSQQAVSSQLESLLQPLSGAVAASFDVTTEVSKQTLQRNLGRVFTASLTADRQPGEPRVAAALRYVVQQLKDGKRQDDFGKLAADDAKAAQRQLAMHSVPVAQVPLPNFAAAAPASYATSGPPGFFGGSSGMGPAPTFTSGPSYGSRGSGRGGGRGGGGPPPARMLL